jgi:hypothetical protein
MFGGVISLLVRSTRNRENGGMGFAAFVLRPTQARGMQVGRSKENRFQSRQDVFDAGSFPAIRRPSAGRQIRFRFNNPVDRVPSAHLRR